MIRRKTVAVLLVVSSVVVSGLLMYSVVSKQPQRMVFYDDKGKIHKMDSLSLVAEDGTVHRVQMLTRKEAQEYPVKITKILLLDGDRETGILTPAPNPAEYKHVWIIGEAAQR